MHYYKKNIGDYHKKAGRLSMLQHGAYTLLIDACYDREQFPTLEQAIEWSWASSKEEIEAVEFVIRRFFIEEDGVFLQKRIAQEIENYKKNAETNKRIALERETKRREKSTKRAPIVNDLGKKTNEAPPNQEPRTTNQEPLTKDKTHTSSVIEIFQYWRDTMKKNPATTKITPKRDKAIKQRLKDGYTVEAIKTAIHNCSLDPYSMGQNNRNKPFNDIELICRSGEKLEFFLDGKVKQTNGRPDLDNQDYHDGDIPR